MWLRGRAPSTGGKIKLQTAPWRHFDTAQEATKPINTLFVIHRQTLLVLAGLCGPSALNSLTSWKPVEWREQQAPLPTPLPVLTSLHLKGHQCSGSRQQRAHVSAPASHTLSQHSAQAPNHPGGQNTSFHDPEGTMTLLRMDSSQVLQGPETESGHRQEHQASELQPLPAQPRGVSLPACVRQEA